MLINEFIVKFAEQFEETDNSVFSPKTKFKNLEEWSSILALSLIAMTDEEFGKELTGEEIRKAETIQDLFEILSEK